MVRPERFGAVMMPCVVARLVRWRHGQARDWSRVVHRSCGCAPRGFEFPMVSSRRCRTLQPEGGAVMWCERGTWRLSGRWYEWMAGLASMPSCLR